MALVVPPLLCLSNLSNLAYADSPSTLSSGQVRDLAIDAEEAAVDPAPAPAVAEAAPEAAPPAPEDAPPASELPVAAPAPEPAPVPETAAPADEPAPDPDLSLETIWLNNHQTGEASWYDTYPGTCAHTTAARGTMMQVTNLKTGAITHCRVADYGPQVPGRVIDLSRTSFSELADPSQGVVPVSVEW